MGPEDTVEIVSRVPHQQDQWLCARGGVRSQRGRGGGGAFVKNGSIPIKQTRRRGEVSYGADTSPRPYSENRDSPSCN